MSASPPDLSRLFDPRSIAVVGASASEDKAGFQILKALESFRGTIYPINPRGGEILGNRVYPSLAEVPGPVDLVALVLPAQHSVAVLEEAAAIGTGAAFMVSGGFGETGPDGAALEADVLSVCQTGGVRLLGPNTSGFMRPSRGLTCSFLPAANEIQAGRIGIIAQSGGINLTLAMMAHAAGLGVSLAIGLGNAVDVAMAETLAYLAADPETRAIAIHLEGVRDGRAVYEAVCAAVAEKPVVALPVGKADLGGFAESHTGALMGNHALTVAALRQAGAVVVETLDDALDAAYALSVCRLPRNPAPGIGLLTAQAGPGLLMTDTLKTAGIALPDLAPQTVETIRANLPPLTYMTNPVDTGRPSETYNAVLSAISDDDVVDAILAYALIEDATLDIGSAVAEAAAKTPKPVVFATAGVPTRTAEVVARLREAEIPVFTAPDRAARAVRALVQDAATETAGKAHERSAPAAPIGQDPLDEDQAKSMIEAYGIATPKRVVCRGREDAHAALANLAKPVAVKVLDSSITHKTEVGGVHLGISDEAGLDAALDAIERLGAPSCLVEEMAPPGLELILGATNDPSFGPTVLIGLGGTAAEAMGDVALALAPLSESDIERMIDGLAGRALLGPWRGKPAPDRAAITGAVLALARLIQEHPEIKEIDLNPVRIYESGLVALDALILI